MVGFRRVPVTLLSMFTRLFAIAALMIVVGFGLGAAAAAAADSTVPPPTSTAVSPVTNPNTDETVPATFADGLTFNQCVGQAVQLPGCGTKPTQAGDRGGALQLTLFGLMTGGMLLIAWRISRAIRQRDRVLNRNPS